MSPIINPSGGGGSGGSQPIVSATRDLTSAEILALTTPIQLVAAPAANQFFNVIAASFYLHAGTTPYTADGQLHVNWGTTDTWQAAEARSNFINSATDLVVISGSAVNFGNNIPAAEILGLGLFSLGTGSDPTLGNGTIRIVLKYLVMDAKP